MPLFDNFLNAAANRVLMPTCCALVFPTVFCSGLHCFNADKLICPVMGCYIKTLNEHNLYFRSNLVALSGIFV